MNKKKIKNILKKSTLFDEIFYLKNYRDARISPLKPIEHYIEYGLENRRPNSWFDPDWYINHYPDIQKSDIAPFLHYILYGIKEFRFSNSKEYQEYEQLKDSFDRDFYRKKYQDLSKLEETYDLLWHYVHLGKKEGREIKILPPQKDEVLVEKEEQGDSQEVKKSFLRVSKLLSYLDPKPTIFDMKVDIPVDILIPIYNGLEYLLPLFESIIKNTTMPYRLLVCDDASSDYAVYELLEKIKSENANIHFNLYRNKKNLGFVQTINHMVKDTKNHFVLLNTDTEVPPHWLERLMYPIFCMDKVATTTPFTNAGTICSFPNYLEDNGIYENLGVAELDSFFKKVNFKNTYIEIPTGVGFCMGVNRNLVEKIGMFDIRFGKGYGEENDFCQRAIEEGYRNLHVTNLFVYHKHGGSFSTQEKRRLLEENCKILLSKHPTYNAQVEKTIHINHLEDLRLLLEAIITFNKKRSFLLIDHALGGGSNYYAEEKVEKCLKSDQNVFLLRFNHYEKEFDCTLYFKEKQISIHSENLTMLEELLKYFHFNEIFLNSLVSYPNIEKTIEMIKNLQHTYQANLTIPIHDYFPLCPNYTLFNYNINEYCNLPSLETEICRKCLTESEGDFRLFDFIPDLERWRMQWRDLLSVANKILLFSYASQEIFDRVYPEFKGKSHVIYHDISGRYKKIYIPSLKEKPRVIGVLGGIHIPKGALMIKKMVKYLEDHDIAVKIVLIGEISEPIKSEKFYMTGGYNRSELPEIVQRMGITEFFIPSVWPETFSYTTDEIMQMGYPLTVFDIGAPAERVRDYEFGNVIKISEWEEFLHF